MTRIGTGIAFVLYKHGKFLVCDTHISTEKGMMMSRQVIQDWVASQDVKYTIFKEGDKIFQEIRHIDFSLPFSNHFCELTQPDVFQAFQHF